MKLENEFLLVEIAAQGAEVTRIFNKKDETDVLWEGNPVFWCRHSPLLFPYVGKTYQNKLWIDGKQYDTEKHGFARTSLFDCVAESENSVTYMLKDSEETKKMFPYAFELYVTYTLEENRLNVKWEVRNPADKTRYFCIGGHPAIRFAKPEEKKTDYVLKFPGKKTLEYIGVIESEAAADPDTIYKMELENECYPLTEELLANDALIFDHEQFDEVWVCHKDGRPYVGMKYQGIPSMGIWSMPNAPFVCLEPWMGRCDNVGFNKDISEKPFINHVDAGETFVNGYELIVAVNHKG